MSRLSFFAAVFGLAAGTAICAAPVIERTDAARVPVLLELFTSEGCSDCPPADRLLEYFDVHQPVAGADLIVLGEHVDYWDNSKWRDRFSSPQYSARQQDYSNKYHLSGVYTPELVVDGRFGFVGSDGNKATSAIGRAIGEPKIPIAISNAARDGDRVTAHIELNHIELNEAGRNINGSRAVLYVAIADNRAESHVGGGENRGESLVHIAVMRVLKQEGTIDPGSTSAKDVALVVPPGVGANGLRIVVFVQDPKSGHILGVTAQRL